MVVRHGRRLDDQVPPGAEDKGLSPGPQEGSLRDFFAGAYEGTVGFVGREKFKVEDRWTDAVRDLGQGRWTGWTFSKLKVYELASVPPGTPFPGEDVL